MKLTIGRKISLAMAVMTALIAVSALSANISMFAVQRTINNLVTKSSPLVTAAHKMDAYKTLARFELRDYLTEHDPVKLKDIEERFHRFLADHDRYEKIIYQAIEDLDEEGQPFKRIWKEAMETFRPDFDRFALEAINNHQDYLALRKKRLAATGKYEEHCAKVHDKIVELQDKHFYTGKINKSLSNLKDLHTLTLLTDDKYISQGELVSDNSRQQLKRRYQTHTNKFADVLTKLEEDAARINKQGMTTELASAHKGLVHFALGENMLFDLHEQELQQQSKIQKLVEEIDRLGEKDSQMAQMFLNLTSVKFKQAGSKTYNTASFMSVGLIAFCVLAFVVSWMVVSILSRQIVKPVEALSIASRRIACGNHAGKVDFSSSDEIGELCSCFNEMSRELSRQVTERKKAEDHSHELLNMLEEKNKELQSVVYVASHDLRSPLVTINGFSEEVGIICKEIEKMLEEESTDEELKKKIIPLLREGIPEDLRFIFAGTSKMQMLVGGLLQVSRIGTAALNMEPLDINQMMNKIEEAMQYCIVNNNAKLNVDHLPKCYGDESMINQVFSNLLDNAMKYHSPERDPVVNFTGWTDNANSIYCVSDNGIGISKQNQAKIFEIFNRLDPNGSVGGEGLGLTIIGRILDRHGGSIWVESEPGQGSSFFVSLPGVV